MLTKSEKKEPTVNYVESKETGTITSTGTPYVRTY